MSEFRTYENSDTGNNNTISLLDDEPDSPESVIDFTADELDSNIAQNQYNKAGSSIENSIEIDDDVYAFFVEAGLEDPEEFKMLGIDIEEIHNQKAIVQRLEQQQQMDHDAAAALQREFELQRTLPPANFATQEQQAIKRDSSFMSQTAIKRELSNIVENYNNKRAKTDIIELSDGEDDDDCIDLTEEIEDLTSDSIMQEQFDSMNKLFDKDNYDSGDDSELEDYLSNVPWNRRPHNGMSRPPFRGNGGAGGEYAREQGDFSLFGEDGFGYHVYGAHMEGIARAEAERRQLPNISTPRNIATTQEAEKELRDLLTHVLYDDPPPPESRHGTPDGLAVNLMEHQKIGLQWMLKMERSNNKGGILADDMGLGKTIQAISTIIENPCENPTIVDHAMIRSLGPNDQLNIKATLVVCPVSLIDQWRREIESKTDPPLDVLVYHGSGRTQNPFDLATYDVIVSSYAVTASNFQENRKGPFAKVNFHRVVLDEAHTIKNKATRAAQGCCAVDATYRWAMTATPIQNKIDELYSLIKFLRIRPFCEWEEFRDCISKPMKDGNRKKAIRVSQVLMKAISLRRSKKALIDGRPILQLPERNVNMTHIDFSPDERQHYDFVNQRAQARFNKYMALNTVMKNYSSVLVLLLRLRQACLHPSLTLQEGDGTEQILPDDQKELAEKMKPDVVKRLLDSEATKLEEIECPICMDIATNAQIITGCGHILCKECFDSYWNTNDGNTKRCPECRGELEARKLITVDAFLKAHAPELYEEAQQEITPEEVEDIKLVQEFVSSAKIDKMIEILNETEIESGGQDKTIVFSQFTGMLDLVEKPLKDNGYKYLRYDGSMDVKKRAEAVNIFFDDPEVKVMLVSTKCGSLGLNLTCANRVIILDVWWNPALENQAIDRVHRIGQQKDVHVHRLFINDTVEDRILELQDKKQNIADGVLGEGNGAPMGRLGLNEMIYLFRGGNPPGNAANPIIQSAVPMNRALPNVINRPGPSNLNPAAAGPSSSRR